MANLQVCAGATLQCSFGAAPSVLNVLPTNRTMVGGVPAATLVDSIPIVNITPFAMCQSTANPTVIAATAAALGVFTPMPCVPVTPALDAQGTLICAWGGVIKVAQPGQVTTFVP
jgi:hypothetical protein